MNDYMLSIYIIIQFYYKLPNSLSYIIRNIMSYKVFDLPSFPIKYLVNIVICRKTTCPLFEKFGPRECKCHGMGYTTRASNHEFEPIEEEKEKEDYTNMSVGQIIGVCSSESCFGI